MWMFLNLVGKILVRERKRHPIHNVNEQIGAKGFEPSASWSQTRRSSQAELRPEIHWHDVSYSSIV